MKMGKPPDWSAASSTAVPLAGITCMVLGALIMTFDYPQIEYLGGFGAGADAAMAAAGDAEQRSLYGRLVTEFAIGAAIFGAGIVMCVPRAASALLRRGRRQAR
ncbi:MAG: hypothetical protein J4F28_06570 [Nitrosopumilaceae archaeon]|nr:hypothetical protein [Nitrosopumilaceae archaeon]